MEEAPENGKESSNSAHANGMNDRYIINILHGAEHATSVQSLKL